MQAIAQGLNAYAGFFSMLIVCIGAYFASKSLSRSKNNEDANNAQQRAINAMNVEISMLTRRVDDTAKENAHLKRTIDTVRIALEKRGFVITISDDAVDIEDSKRSTTIRIQEDI